MKDANVVLVISVAFLSFRMILSQGNDNTTSITVEYSTEEMNSFGNYILYITEEGIPRSLKLQNIHSPREIKSFFLAFPRICIYLGERTQQLGVLEDLSNILKHAASYNQRKLRQKRKYVPVEIWISANYDKYKFGHLQKLLNVTAQANSIFSGTVTNLVVISDFPELNIPDFSVKMGNLAHKLQHDNLKLTLLVDYFPELCPQLKMFPRYSISSFIFIIKNVTEEIVDTQQCFDTDKTFWNSTTVGFSFKMSVAFNYTDRFYTFNFHDNTHQHQNMFQNLTKANSKYFLLIDDFSLEREDGDDGKTCKNNKQQIRNWIYSESDLQKYRPSFSIYFDSKYFEMEKLIPEILQAPNLIIENAYKLTDASLLKLSQFVAQILETSEHGKSRLLFGAQVYLKLNFFTKNTIDEYVTWTLMFLNLLNDQYEERIDGVVVDLMEEDINDTDIYSQIFKAIKGNSSDEVITIKLGAVMYDCRYKRIPENADILLFLHSTRVRNNCRQDARKRFYDEFSRCLEISGTCVGKDVDILHQVVVHGYYRNLSSLTQLAAYGLTMHDLLNVASLKEIAVYISPAFEPSWKENANDKDDVCNFDNEYSTHIITAYDERCSQGWWVIFKDSNLEGYSLLDKKQVARAIFFESQGNSKNRSSSTGVLKLQNGLRWQWILLICFGVVVIMTTGIIVTFLILKFRASQLLELKEIQAFFYGEKQVGTNEEGSGYSSAFEQKYNKNLYEIPKSEVTIDEDHCLGSGQYGIVCLGAIFSPENQMHIPVAVKMTKKFSNVNRDSRRAALRGLISEIKVLSYIGDHNHIIRLYGANTTKLRRGEAYVFLEYCSEGSLYKYLCRLSSSVEATTTTEKENGEHETCFTSIPLDLEISQDLHRWSREIVDGMVFLASKHIVHADLATRNVLLNADRVSKIADFGLSRRLYDYTEYVKTNQEPLPWRWMAPEALKKLEFTEMTDVWSFGVTLWEIYTLGDLPYPGLAWDVNFPNKLERGLKLGMPKYNEKEMYSVMLRCWEVNPERRPNFVELKRTLNMHTFASE